MAPVLESFERLKARADLVLVEGAGSPAEVNLRARDIANMGFARAADVPVVLVGDIDRGGVIAQIVGTKAVLDPADAAMIAGFIINKFRGDPSLFDDGYATDRRRHRLARLWRAAVLSARSASCRPKTRSILAGTHARARRKIACLRSVADRQFRRSRSAASWNPSVDLVMVRPGEAIPGDATLVIIPGSKSTRGDLAFPARAGLGHRHSARITAAAGTCSGSAAATRCSGPACPILLESRVPRAQRPGSACSM